MSTAASTSSSNSNASVSKMKPKKPLDVWSTREKLSLASAVYKIGDQNWLSVSRTIKQYAEPNRPETWFHQKNCVSQYYDMLEQLEQQQPKRKRGDKYENDTPSLQIMRKMTIERSEQLKKEIMEMQQAFLQMQNEVEEINNGQWDDRLEEEYELLRQEELREEEEERKAQIDENQDDDSKSTDAEISELLSVTGEGDETTQESMDDMSMADEDSQQNVLFDSSASQSDAKSGTPAASLLLSSLLQSEEKSATGLQQLKQEQEEGSDSATQSAVPKLEYEDSATSSPAAWSEVAAVDCVTVEGVVEEVLIEEQVVDHLDTHTLTEEVITSTMEKEVGTHSSHMNELPLLESLEDSPVVDTMVIKRENTEQEQKGSKLDVQRENNVKVEDEKNMQDAEEISKKIEESLAGMPVFADIKDEPMSPTSSVSSRMSEPGTKRGGRGKGRSKSIRSPRMSASLSARKSYTDDGGSSRHSDVEMSDDDARETDDIVGDSLLASTAGTSLLSESFPNSPASLSMCSDTEEEKSFKAWKKSILMVWRAASAHKYASVFTHPVTDDIAPGYHTVIKRPMDLSTIKKNIETGVIRTTPEFQRDMMLMFTNAVMYNSSLHNVYNMAQVMYDDVLQHIEQYVNTQMMMQTTDSKNLRQSRRTEADGKEEDPKKRRLSVEQSESGKTKKRKPKEEIITL